MSVVRQSTLEVCTVWPAKRQLQLHSQMNDIIWMAVKMAQITALKEPTGLLRSDDKRPDGAILIPWVKGKAMAWDVTAQKRRNKRTTLSHCPPTLSDMMMMGRKVIFALRPLLRLETVTSVLVIRSDKQFIFQSTTERGCKMATVLVENSRI